MSTHMNSEILLIRSTVFPETFYSYSHQRSSNVYQLYLFKVLPSTSEPQSSSTTAVFAQEQKNNANTSASTTSVGTKFYTFCCEEKGKVHLKH